ACHGHASHRSVSTPHIVLWRCRIRWLPIVGLRARAAQRLPGTRRFQRESAARARPLQPATERKGLPSSVLAPQGSAVGPTSPTIAVASGSWWQDLGLDADERLGFEEVDGAGSGSVLPVALGN